MYAADDLGIPEAVEAAKEAVYAPPDAITPLLYNTSSTVAYPVTEPQEQKPIGGTRYVGDDKVRLRTEPGLSSGILGSMNTGDEVIFTGNKTTEIDGHLWAEVIYNSQKGWVAADYLKISNPTATNATQGTPKQSVESNSGEKAKNSGTADTPAETTKKKEAVDSSEELTSEAGTRYVGGNNLRLRAAPGTKSDVLDMIKKGAEVKYTGNKTEEIDGHMWAEVEYDGKIGWVAADYLKIDESEVETSDSNNSQDYFDNSDIENDDIQLNDKSYLEATLSPHQVWKNKPFTLQMQNGEKISPSPVIKLQLEKYFDEFTVGKSTFEICLDEGLLESLRSSLTNDVKNMVRPHNIPRGTWARQIENDLKWIDEMFGPASKTAKCLKAVPYISIGIDAAKSIYDNTNNNAGLEETVSDVAIEIAFGASSAILSNVFAGMVSGALKGSVGGGVVGAAIGATVGIIFGIVTQTVTINGRSAKDVVDDAIDCAIDGIQNWFS